MSSSTPSHRLLAALGAAALLIALTGAAPSRPRDVVALVPNWALTPEQIASSCKVAIAGAKRRIDAIARSHAAPTFATVVAPLETAEAELGDELAAQQFLFSVASDAQVRDASQQCNTDVGNFLAAQSARPDVYRAVLAAARSGTAHDAADRKLQDMYVTGGVRAGAALSDAKRHEFVMLQQRLNDLQNAFQANLANDATTIAITADQATGLPPDFVAKLKPDSAGGYIVPVNESTVGTFMRYDADAAARKAFYFAYNNRGAAKNIAVLGRAIATRDRLAHLVGAPNWATYVLADRMARTPARVTAFLHDLDVALLPKARAERAELAALKGRPLDAWDLSYYQNQLRKSRFSVDEELVKSYFPVEHVLSSILAIYAKLLAVTFTAQPAAATWAPGVSAYDVHDAATGALLGSFYLDLFPRPGKYSHFANVPVEARRVLGDGSVRAPLNVIVGNWPAPVPGKPALLTHGDVVTFFHEFGHNMAAMLAATPYATLNEGFRWDFVEAPSQMLENWCWDPTILKQISADVTTGAPLPDDLIARIIRTRSFDEAYSTTVQIMYATVDMRYHTLGANVDTTAVWRTTVDQTTPNRFVDGVHPQASFGHIMGGYDAGYYGYLWSKVYAQDMFSAFQSAGLTNPNVGRRYRDDLLAPARTFEPDAEVSRFLGRPMLPDAFYRELGIPTSKRSRPA